MRHFLNLLVAIAALLMLALPANAKRVALVIGNSDYSHVARLKNPQKDAADLAETLRATGFEDVVLKENLDYAQLRRALASFTRIAAGADIAVVYFAGHGIEVNGSNYILPVDARLDHVDDIEFEAIELDKVLGSISRAGKLKLVILDACRNNPFKNNIQGMSTSRSVGRGLAPVQVRDSDTLVAYAAKEGTIAADGDGDNSPYARALIDNLATPGVDIRLVFGRVRDAVLASTGSRQEPFTYGSLGGEAIYLAPPAKDTDESESLATLQSRIQELESRLGGSGETHMPADAQVAAFNFRFKGNGSDSGRAIVPLPGGDFIVAGQKTPTGTHLPAGWVARFGPSGRLRWQDYIQDSDSLILISDAFLLPDGDMFLVGTRTKALLKGATFLFLARMDLEGRIVWRRDAGQIFKGGTPSAIMDSDGNVLVAAIDADFLEMGKVFLASFNSDSTRRWRTVFERPDIPLVSVLKTGRTFKLAYQKLGSETQSREIVINTVSRNGAKQKSHSIDIASNRLNGIISLDNNDILAYGTTAYVVEGNNSWAYRLTDDGAAIWQKTFEKSLENEIHTAMMLIDGSILIASSSGKRNSLGKDALSLWISKIDRNGTTIGEKTLPNGNANNMAYGLGITTNNTIVVTGVVHSVQPPNLDVFIAGIPASALEPGSGTTLDIAVERRD